MLQIILTGQAKSFPLLLWAIFAYLYFLPSILAFLRGHRGFFVLLALNVVLAPLQSAVLQHLFPSLFVLNPAIPGDMILIALLSNLGLGWFALMVWAMRPVPSPDPRLLRAQNTKLYDALAGLPLALWFAYGALQLRPTLVADAARMLAGTGTLLTWVQFFALFAGLSFNLILVWLLLVRDKPVLKSRGLLPRLCGFVGTFLGVGILQLPVVTIGLPMQIVAAALVGLGSGASAFVLVRLGKSFSILPEARTLVTSGPYAWARHPLYAVELLIIIGTSIQFAQPWATLLAISVAVLLVIRSHYEEQVLAAAYPEYAAYRAKTARFIPGLF
jgi:protein-S-isoprenylcysteine O-methyltransferase Ste14